MILDFRFKNYKCQYYTGSEYISYACFSKGYKFTKDGYAYITYKWSKHNQSEKNYCFLSTHEILSYLHEISNLLGFHLISLAEYETYYKLQIRFVPCKRYFLYISTYIRYMWEYPFSFLLYTALQNKFKFPELNITQIMSLYAGLFVRNDFLHGIGNHNKSFRNINAKCQYNLLSKCFNHNRTFIDIHSNHSYLSQHFKVFNTKQLPQITKGINLIVDKYYVKYKKSICCW